MGLNLLAHYNKDAAAQGLPAQKDQAAPHTQPRPAEPQALGRRQLFSAAGACCTLVASPRAAQAVQGLTPGRVPGVTAPADAEGFVSYTRPTGKSGGHGVGWSEVPRYSLRIPANWAEVPVSIADLGGTEIDLRYASKEEGQLQVVVAPVLRFKDVGYNADVRIRDLGSPATLISGFFPELFQATLQDDDLLDSAIVKRGPLEYYEMSLKRNRLVSATAFGNRAFLLAVSANNARQWRKAEPRLRKILESFSVSTA